MSVSGLCSPISVREFTSTLTPSFFYDCDKVFSADPSLSQFAKLNYNDGVEKAFLWLWGYLILITVAQIVNVILQNINSSLLMRMSSRTITGLLDLIYQKILIISDAARSTSATGNITNLLFTDTQKIAFMLLFMMMIIQVPIDLVIYIIYLGVQIAPIALTGLIAFLIFIPIIVGVMGKIAYYQKKIMSMADLRMKRATEVLNGIKVIKLFSLEEVQHARLQNARNKEIKTLL